MRKSLYSRYLTLIPLFFGFIFVFQFSAYGFDGRCIDNPALKRKRCENETGKQPYEFRGYICDISGTASGTCYRDTTTGEGDQACVPAGADCFCCYDNRKNCAGDGGSCLTESQCSAYPGSTILGGSDVYNCNLGLNEVCCQAEILHCGCEDHTDSPHECSDVEPPEEPGGYWTKMYGIEYSCGGCGGGDCWKFATANEAFCESNGYRCADMCPPGQDLGERDCGAGKVCCYTVRPRPSGLLYTGPVIKNLQDILGPVAKMLYYGGLAIGVFFIILSGYRLMTSEGDPQRTKAAQEQLTTAIIGIIFILLSVTILRVIINQIIGKNI